jgi:hypothetical protein
MKRARLSLCIAGAYAAIACSTSAVDAQAVEGHALGVRAAYADVRLVSADEGDRTLGGILLGAEGRASWRTLQMDVQYMQGRVRGSGPGSDGADIRVAQGLVGIRVLPWVVLHAGPRFLETETSGRVRSTLRWQAGASVSVPLVRDWVHGFGSAVGSVAGSELDPQPYTGRGGVTVGFTLTPAGLPTWASVGYRMDKEGNESGVRTIETIQIGIGWRGG